MRTTPYRYRAGIIGMGFIGESAPDSHLRAYIECDRTHPIGFFDPYKYPLFSHWVGSIYEGPAILGFSSQEELLKQDLDIVSVCTPVETHCKIVCDIAPYVRAIYCEKSMATTLEECQQMIDACEKHGTILQINHQRRFVKPLFRFGRDLIDTGTHVFDWLNQYEMDADIEYVDTQEHIFELVITRERMILAGVEWLVGILDGLHYEKSNGYDGKIALEKALEFKEWYGLQHNKKR